MRTMWQCDNCRRLSSKETWLVTVAQFETVTTMGGVQTIEGDPRALRICAVCVKAADAVGDGSVLMNQFGAEIK